MYNLFSNWESVGRLNKPLKIDVPANVLYIFGCAFWGMCWVFDNNQPLKIDVPTDDHKLALPSRLTGLRKKTLKSFHPHYYHFHKCRVIVAYLLNTFGLKKFVFLFNKIISGGKFSWARNTTCI